MPSIAHSGKGDYWDSFWRFGVQSDDLLALLKVARNSINVGDDALAMGALRDFTNGHQHFAVSPTDGAPLFYGRNLLGELGTAFIEAMPEVDIWFGARNAGAEDLAVLSRLRRFHGNLNGALDAARQATAKDDACAAGYLELGALHRIHARVEEAAWNYEMAAELAPDNAEVLLECARFLQNIGWHEAAVGHFRRAIKGLPDDPRGYHNVAVSLLAVGKTVEGLAMARRAVEIRRNRHTFYHLAFCQLSSGDNAGAVKTCTEALQTDPMDSMPLALMPSALDAVGRGDEARALCDFASMIKVFDLRPPAIYQTMDAFNKAVVEAALRAPRRIEEPFQTNDLFLPPKGPFVYLQEEMKNIVRAYYDNVPQMPGHPFLSQRMTDWKIDGWATRMTSYGENQPHFHKHAWLSGVYYAKVPASVKNQGTEEGWLEFSRMPSYDGQPKDVEVAALPPREGMMVIFPSYLHHRVLPFSGDDMRVSIAFNLVPTDR